MEEGEPLSGTRQKRISTLSRPLNEETLGLLHLIGLVEVVPQVHLSLEETLGLLPMMMMSKPPLPKMMMSKSPLRYTILNEETLGLLHMRNLVEAVPQVHLSLEEKLGLLHNDDVVEVPFQVHISQ